MKYTALPRSVAAMGFCLCLGAVAQIQNDLPAEIARISVKASPQTNAAIDMPVHVFKPTLTQLNAGAGPWPVVIFSHGRAGTVEERAALKTPASAALVRYWHGKGYAVVAAVRPGYGDHTAEDPEDHGARWNGNVCSGAADFRKTALAAAQSIRQIQEWLPSQSWANKERIVLVGQSVGGLATVAASGQNLPGVVGCINFAGGSGGNPRTSPGASCQPDRLGEVLSSAASSTRMPSLWLYAANDLYWGPDAPKKWHQAHVQAAMAAGQKTTADFYAAPAVSQDGHRLLAAGTGYWQPVVGDWLKKNGF
jgi:dienelactone hydrolase